MAEPRALELLTRLRRCLEAAFGARLEGVLLYGSAARGDVPDESDIDVMVLLAGPVHWGRDLSRVVEAVYPLQLEVPDRPLHAIPVDSAAFQAGDYALYRNAQREGIRL
jgi:predicted nucleotidyltransferase